MRSRVLHAALGVIALLMVLLASAAWTAPRTPGGPGHAAPAARD